MLFSNTRGVFSYVDRVSGSKQKVLIMTASEARRDLPSVAVKIGKHTLTGRVTGRLNPVATVTVDYIHNGKPGQYLRDFGAPWIDAHFSWDAIARAATTGEPLTF